MKGSIYKIPEPVNETVLNYASGSEERQDLMNAVETLQWILLNLIIMEQYMELRGFPKDQVVIYILMELMIMLILALMQLKLCLIKLMI